MKVIHSITQRYKQNYASFPNWELSQRKNPPIIAMISAGIELPDTGMLLFVVD
jgi:hypothetical protein